MKIERVWSMPDRWTFRIQPIQKLLWEEGVRGRILGQMEAGWYDPFSGKNSPCEFRNDLSDKTDAGENMDALEWLKTIETGVAEGVLYDPPYSMSQAKSKYGKGFGGLRYWKECKDQVARITKPGGKSNLFRLEHKRTRKR